MYNLTTATASERSTLESSLDGAGKVTSGSDFYGRLPRPRVYRLPVSCSSAMGVVLNLGRSIFFLSPYFFLFNLMIDRLMLAEK